MTIEDKMKHIKDVAMEEARAQGNVIMDGHIKALEQVFETHRQEEIRQMDTRIKVETTSARQQLNTAASKEQLKLRRDLGKVQMQLKNQLFQEVRSLVDDYKKTDKYKDYLVYYIKKAADYAKGQPLSVFIDPSDEGLKSYLEDHTGLSITVSKEDFIGGVRSVIPGKNILIDRSFQGSLERAYEEFTFKGGDNIE